MTSVETKTLGKATVRTISMDEFVERIADQVRLCSASDSPLYSMILGSGFSYGLIPTAEEMLLDIPWWLYCQNSKFDYLKTERQSDDEGFSEYRIGFWKKASKISLGSPLEFELSKTSHPTSHPENISCAYQSLMTVEGGGLSSPNLRRSYLRDVIKRSTHKLNESYLYLAGLIKEQDEWKFPFCKTIFTTNFDPFLQISFQLANQLYFMSDQPAHVEDPYDDSLDAVHLFYAHGSIHRPLLCNNEEEIKRARSNHQKLAGYFARHGVIVIGYSGWDDILMSALNACQQFNHNLYWCGRGSLETQSDAVIRLLGEKAGSAVYVEIDDADSLMKSLYKSLNGIGNPDRDDDAPKFICEPWTGLVEEFKGCQKIIKIKPRLIVDDLSSKVTIENLDTSLGAVISDTIESLESISTDRKSPRGSVHQLFHESLMAARKLKWEKAAQLWTRIIEHPDAAPPQIAKAYIRRATANWKLNPQQLEDSIDDCTAVIQMLDEPNKETALAYIIRGASLGQLDLPQYENAIRDFTATIELADSSPQEKALAYLSRGMTYGQLNPPQHDNEIGDYTSIIETPNLQSTQKARAYFNRALTYGQLTPPLWEEAIKDHSAIIEMQDAPNELKIRSLFARGIAHGQLDPPQRKNEADDYTAIIEVPDVSDADKARAYVNRGTTYGQFDPPQIEDGINDFATVIAMVDVPNDQKARAYLNRSVVYSRAKPPQWEDVINDCTAVIELPDVPSELMAKAHLTRGIAHSLIDPSDWERAIADHTAVIEMPDAPVEQLAFAYHNRGEAYFNLTPRNEEDAVSDWKKLLEIEDVPIEAKGRAAFDLACFAAMNGNTRESTKWLRKSVSFEFLNHKSQLDNDAYFALIRTKASFNKIRNSLL